VLENVTGLSGTYVRFQTANSEINQERFYKDGFEYKSKPVEQRYARLLSQATTASQVGWTLYWFFLFCVPVLSFCVKFLRLWESILTDGR
jgi:ABC-type multidrug transport system permease subunit